MKPFRDFVTECCQECGSEPGCNIDCATCKGLKEDEGAGAPANSAGTGNIAGLGVGKAGKPANWGEPGVKRRRVDEADAVTHKAFDKHEPVVDASTRELDAFHPEPDYSSHTDDELDVWLRTKGEPTSADWKAASQPETRSESVFDATCRDCGHAWSLTRNVYGTSQAAAKANATCPSCKGWAVDVAEGSSEFDYSSDVVTELVQEGLLESEKPTDTFAGAPVFEVDMDKVHKSRFGKNRYHRYSRYVGEDEVGEQIRQHGRSRKSGDIILKDSKTSVMTYLRRKSAGK